MFTALLSVGRADPIIDKILNDYRDQCVMDRENLLYDDLTGDELPAVFTLAPNAVYEIELAPDGTTGTVVYHEFHCLGLGYQWCGSNGCGFHIVVDDVAFERFGGGRPFSVGLEDSTFIITPLHRGSCRSSDGVYGVSSACYDIATWDTEENTFIGHDNRIKARNQGNRASEAFDECAQEVVAPTCLLELHAV